MRAARWLVGLTLTLLTPAAELWACSCESAGPPCQNAYRSATQVVFAGTVRSITPVPEDQDSRPAERRLPRRLRVEFDSVVPFLGVHSADMHVLTADNGPSCGYEFKAGERYVVYADPSRDGSELETTRCSRTRPLAAAAEDLAFFQSLSAPHDDRARVVGTIEHFEADLATRQTVTAEKMAGLRVTAMGAAGAVDALTDADGRYELKLPPGTYDVSVLPPSAFSARYLERAVQLRDARACAVLDFRLRFDGRIGGVLRGSSGEPLAQTPVQAIAADNVRKTSTNIEVLRASTDAGGRYEFKEVPPGRYVVGVDLVRRIDAAILFQATFYPGTADPASTTVIELDGGQQLELEPLTLPHPRQDYKLAGVVVFEDGSPAAGAFLSLSDGLSPWRSVASGIKAGPDGSFSFVVHEGLGYLARGSFWDQAQKRSLSGSVGPFVVSGEPESLKLVLTPVPARK